MESCNLQLILAAQVPMPPIMGIFMLDIFGDIPQDIFGDMPDGMPMPFMPPDIP